LKAFDDVIQHQLKNSKNLKDHNKNLNKKTSQTTTKHKQHSLNALESVIIASSLKNTKTKVEK
jgi:hypothetical protein